MPNKKPTMKEVKTVIDNILIHMSSLEKGLRGLDSALSSYIEFKKDRDKWLKWIEERTEKLKKEANESRSKESRNSSGGTGATKVGKQTPSK